MFKKGFEKIASPFEHFPGGHLGLAAYLVGAGALGGHAAHVNKKLMSARAGKTYKEESFVDKHPVLTGALSLGAVPGLSAAKLQNELDKKNERVKKVKREHPHMTAD